jgi:Uma2 family endonuclease
MAETQVHLLNMFDTIAALMLFFKRRRTYVAGNMFIYYEKGNPRKHISPDVFVVRGISKRLRDYYLLWQEKKTLDLVIEFTSRSTRLEDVRDKFTRYQDILKVQEYFLFDPYEEYLKPSLKGYRLLEGKYEPIEEVAGRLPSKVLGLHLGREDWRMRLYDPKTGVKLPIPEETAAALEQHEAALEQQDAALKAAQAENDRLRRELDELRRGQPKPGSAHHGE